MRGLYQWFSDRASFFRSDFVGRGTSRTVRTEVTVQREAMTLMVSEAPAAFGSCPLCGQKIAPAQVWPARLRLEKASTSRESVPGDGFSP